MQKSQTASLLGNAALYDNRTIDQATIEAWHLVMGGIDYDDACEALRHHITTSTDYLMPVHIVQGVKRIRRARLDRGTAAEGIPDADPDDVAAYLAAMRKGLTRVAAGEDLRERPVAQLVQQAAKALPRVPGRDHA